MRRGLGDNDLESWGDDARQEVAAANRAVLQSNHRMKMMQARLAIVASRDVADQAQHLTLLADVDRLVFLGCEIKPADLSREGADRRYRGVAGWQNP